jgi:hypothetical protein
MQPWSLVRVRRRRSQDERVGCCQQNCCPRWRVNQDLGPGPFPVGDGQTGQDAARQKTVVSGLPGFDMHSGDAMRVVRLGVPNLGHDVDAVRPRRSAGALKSADAQTPAYRPARRPPRNWPGRAAAGRRRAGQPGPTPTCHGGWRRFRLNRQCRASTSRFACWFSEPGECETPGRAAARSGCPPR